MPRGHRRACSRAGRSGLATATTALWLVALAPAAQAGSITANTSTYAGDVGALKFPVGTLAVTNYTAWRDAGAFYDTDGVRDGAGNLDVVTNVARVDWMAANIHGMPLVLSASLPYAHVTDAELAGAEASAQSSFFSPNVYVTLGLVVDPANERTLALTTYFFLPAGNYDPTKSVNVATPDQTVIVPQFAYEEGLGKFSPVLKNFWVDIFGGIAFHGDGENPVTVGGVGFTRTEQDHSYDINAYLRYSWNPLTFLALGLEASWGGEQVASGGALGAVLGDVSIGKDEYVKGHLQFGVPLSPTMQLAADITHDFHREGGFKEEFTVELRVSTFVLPPAAPIN
jgi:hypothetical protein